MSRVWAVVRFDGPDGPEQYDMAAGLTQPGSPYLSVREAIEIEQLTGEKPQAWLRALSELDATAWTALVMVLRRRAGQAVRFNDVDFDLLSARLLDVDEHGNVVEEPTEADEVDEVDDSPN
jgi:hypothetical protein